MDDLRDWLQSKFPLDEEMNRVNSAVSIDSAEHESLVRAVFERFDVSHEGYISPDELKAMFEELGWRDDVIRDFLSGYNRHDNNHDGKLSFDEFSRLYGEFSFASKEKLVELATMGRTASDGGPCHPVSQAPPSA